MRLLLRLFPRRFRRRYGTEMLELIDERHAKLRDAADLVVSGLSLRFEDLADRLRRSVRSPRAALWLVLLGAAGLAGLGGCAVVGSAVAAGLAATTARELKPVLRP
jgi:aryl carrier-like protein